MKLQTKCGKILKTAEEKKKKNIRGKFPTMTKKNIMSLTEDFFRNSGSKIKPFSQVTL